MTAPVRCQQGTKPTSRLFFINKTKDGIFSEPPYPSFHSSFWQWSQRGVYPGTFILKSLYLRVTNSCLVMWWCACPSVKIKLRRFSNNSIFSTLRQIFILHSAYRNGFPPIIYFLMRYLLSTAPISDGLLDVKAFDRIWGAKRWIVLTNWAAILGERHPPINILFPFTDSYVWWALASCTMLFLWSLSELAWPAAAYIFISHELSWTWLIGGRLAGRGSRQALQGTVTFIFLSTEIVLDSKAWEQECSESFKSLSSFHAGFVVLRPTDQFDDIIYCTVDLFANLTIK